MTRERDRYPRMTLRDQLEELRDWARAHRLALLIALVALAVLVWLFTPGQPVRPQDLVVGDCLYVRTSAVEDVGPSARPIGASGGVATAVLSGRAMRTGCNESHGHEVSAIIDLTERPPTSPSSAALDVACEGVFESYVGRGMGSSMYETYAVVPGSTQWDAGIHRAICLVARADGQWMTHPARGSGE